MECSLSFLDSDRQSGSKNIQAAVVRQLQVIYARHDAGEIIIGGVWRFAGATDNGKNRGETLEACKGYTSQNPSWLE